MVRQSLAVLAVMIGLGACSVARADDFPTGTFTAKVGDNKMALRFEDKGKFTLTIDGKEAASGTYKAAKDGVEIKIEKGMFTDPNAEKVGKYTWKLDDKKLSFTKVDDPFEGRVKALTSGPWVKE